jgi:putative FmdB family regulatory protein
MPLYEYRCSKCEKKIEVIRKFSDPPLTKHEDCGGALEQLLSAPAFQLKGTGWYVTDYAKAGAKPSSDSGGKVDESKGSDSEAKVATSKDGEGGSGEKKTSEKSSETKSSDSKAEPKPAATTTKSD